MVDMNAGLPETSDIGMMFRKALQATGVPPTAENMRRMVDQARRSPDLIKGLEGLSAQQYGPGEGQMGPQAAGAQRPGSLTPRTAAMVDNTSTFDQGAPAATPSAVQTPSVSPASLPSATPALPTPASASPSSIASPVASPPTPMAGEAPMSSMAEPVPGAVEAGTPDQFSDGGVRGLDVHDYAAAALGGTALAGVGAGARGLVSSMSPTPEAANASAARDAMRNPGPKSSVFRQPSPGSSGDAAADIASAVRDRQPPSSIFRPKPDVVAVDLPPIPPEISRPQPETTPKYTNENPHPMDVKRPAPPAPPAQRQVGRDPAPRQLTDQSSIKMRPPLNTESGPPIRLGQSQQFGPPEAVPQQLLEGPPKLPQLTHDPAIRLPDSSSGPTIQMPPHGGARGAPKLTPAQIARMAARFRF